MKYLSLGHCGNEEIVFKYDEEKVTRGKKQTNIDGDVVTLRNLDKEGWRAELRVRESTNGSWSDYELCIDSVKDIVRDDGLIILGHWGSEEVGLKYDDLNFFIDKEEDAQYINIVGRMVCISNLGKKGCLAVFTAIAAYDSGWDHFELYVYPTSVKEVAINEWS